MNEIVKKRILFVDDEPLVLKGLQRTLRKMRAEWDTAFASTGKEALGILDQQPMDVIVSDLKMPEMDGMQLLTEVKNRHPHVVRIILSGHTEHEVTLRSVQYAHQNLTKPCDAEILKQTLAKLFALRDILDNESVKKIVSQIESLPSLPSIYSEIIEEMQSEDPSIKKISDTISKDLSMTAKILQVVNSVFFGLSRKIGSPQEAVALLGLETPIIEAIAFHHCPANSMAQNMGLLTAVHIGNAIDHNGQPATNGEPDLLYDRQYLDNLGLADRMPEWRKICGELAERN